MTGLPSLLELADGAAEAIRALNHRTLAVSGEVVTPCEVCEVLGALATLAARLPQVQRQLGGALDCQARAGRLTADSWTADNAATIVAHIRRDLAFAGRRAAELGRALDSGHEAAAHLAVRDSSPTPLREGRRPV